MDSTIVAAMIALSGVIVSTVITCIIAFGTRKYNYSQLFAETVSKNRMDWINIWRENLATFLSCARMIAYSGKRSSNMAHSKRRFSNMAHSKRRSSNKDDILKEMYRARERIVLRLNMDEDDHYILYRLLMDSIWENINKANIDKQCRLVEEQAREILKPEWERVKKEAKGKIK